LSRPISVKQDFQHSCSWGRHYPLRILNCIYLVMNIAITNINYNLQVIFILPWLGFYPACALGFISVGILQWTFYSRMYSFFSVVFFIGYNWSRQVIFSILLLPLQNVSKIVKYVISYFYLNQKLFSRHLSYYDYHAV